MRDVGLSWPSFEPRHLNETTLLTGSSQFFPHHRPYRSMYKAKFGSRTFSVADQTSWNVLSEIARSVPSNESLKRHYYNLLLWSLCAVFVYASRYLIIFLCATFFVH